MIGTIHELPLPKIVIPPCSQGVGFAFKNKNVQETQDIIPGDANGDGKVSISDIVYLITYIFKGGAEPFPPCKANVNGDNKVSVGDVVYLINYLFKGGPPLNNGCS